MEKVKIGIIGGAGYTGGELIRLLLNHPFAEIIFVQSKSQADKYIYQVHTDLLDDTTLKFSEQISTDIDILFLCVSHGESKKLLDIYHLSTSVKIIDLSQDFRKEEHATSHKRKFIYGLPELNKTHIQSANNIANPGCFATCIQLGLLPLASEQLLKSEVHISATTGSTGAGQSMSKTSHYSWRNNNLSSYKVMEHQHLEEIRQSIVQLQPDFKNDINFIPYRGSFSRGILATSYISLPLALEKIAKIYKAFYWEHPFVHISDENIDLKQVVNTNKCIIHLEKHHNKLVITSIIDNLLKGASGQAVQNMNLMFGWEETTGLKLKASVF